MKKLARLLLALPLIVLLALMATYTMHVVSVGAFPRVSWVFGDRVLMLTLFVSLGALLLGLTLLKSKT